MGTKEENVPLHAHLKIEVIAHGSHHFEIAGCRLCVLDALANEAANSQEVMTLLTMAMSKAWEIRLRRTELQALALSNRQN